MGSTLKRADVIARCELPALKGLAYFALRASPMNRARRFREVLTCAGSEFWSLDLCDIVRTFAVRKRSIGSGM